MKKKNQNDYNLSDALLWIQNTGTDFEWSYTASDVVGVAAVCGLAKKVMWWMGPILQSLSDDSVYSHAVVIQRQPWTPSIFTMIWSYKMKSYIFGMNNQILQLENQFLFERCCFSTYDILRLPNWPCSFHLIVNQLWITRVSYIVEQTWFFIVTCEKFTLFAFFPIMQKKKLTSK